jgi:hypothetical protein
MRRSSRDPLALTPHWHFDCRIEADLPEDTIVGTRFLINVIGSAIALAALLFAGFLGYQVLSLRNQVADLERRISDHRTEVRDIQRMQTDYAAEAAKIDQAYELVKPEFNVSEFVAHIGQTRPDQMGIDMIEWNDSGVVVRGNLKERSERASRLLGGYVEQLRKDPKITPRFRVDLTDLDRGSTGDVLRFEIMFRLPERSKA